MLEISKELAKRVAKYPKLKECVDDFLKNDGMNPDSMCLTDLTVYIRELDIDEPCVFGWDGETTEDFYSWGHNSRYANVLEPLMAEYPEHHISCLVDYLEEEAKED